MTDARTPDEIIAHAANIALGECEEKNLGSAKFAFLWGFAQGQKWQEDRAKGGDASCPTAQSAAAPSAGATTTHTTAEARSSGVGPTPTPAEIARELSPDGVTRNCMMGCECENLKERLRAEREQRLGDNASLSDLVNTELRQNYGHGAQITQYEDVEEIKRAVLTLVDRVRQHTAEANRPPDHAYFPGDRCGETCPPAEIALEALPIIATGPGGYVTIRRETYEANRVRLADRIEAARREALAEPLRIVREQAADEACWFVAKTAPEAYLQQELRRLHAAVEGKTPEQCVRALLAAQG